MNGLIAILIFLGICVAVLMCCMVVSGRCSEQERRREQRK